MKLQSLRAKSNSYKHSGPVFWDTMKLLQNTDKKFYHRQRMALHCCKAHAI